MKGSRIVSCFLVLLPLAAGCALSDDDTATQLPPGEEIPAAADDAVKTQNLFGSDTCRSTGIHVTNSRTRNGIDTAIEVRWVDYYDASEGAWLTEELSNLILNFGTQGNWNDEDLERTENDLVTRFRVYYRFVEGGDWSDVVYQEIDTTDTTCIAGRNFYMTVQ